MRLTSRARKALLTLAVVAGITAGAAAGHTEPKWDCAISYCGYQLPDGTYPPTK